LDRLAGVAASLELQHSLEGIVYLEFVRNAATDRVIANKSNCFSTGYCTNQARNRKQKD